MHRLTAGLATALTLALSLACGGGDGGEGEKSPASGGTGEGTPTSTALSAIRGGLHPTAVITIAGMGEIRIELLPEIAPQTVANFEKLARQGFYDDTTFHRVVPGFMIQGGDPASRSPDPRQHGRGGPGYTIPDEFTDFPHNRGTVSMANRGYPNSGGSQFFIVHQDSPHLDGHYSAFGRVTDGIDIVDAITQVEIDTYGRYGPKARPYPQHVVVESLRIEEVGGEAEADPGAGAR